MRISIVTISYNQGRFLESAIKSVIGQRISGLDVEYIVVDPGSTDGSRQIIDRYSSEIDRVIVDPDDGPADGLNIGFGHATGEIFGFVNADDWLEPGALRFVHDFFCNHANSTAAVGALRLIDEQGRPLHWSRFHMGATQFPPLYSLRNFLDGSASFHQPSTFFRRRAWEAVGGFNTANTVSWDEELFVEMMLHGIEFARVPYPLAAFRIHPESISGSRRATTEIRKHTTRVRERVVAAGHQPSSPVIAWLRRIAWRLRPMHRLKAMAASIRSSVDQPP